MKPLRQHLARAMSDARRARIAHVLPWATVGGTEVATLRMIQATPAGEFTHVALCAQLPSATQHLLSSAGLDIYSYRPAELSLRNPGPFLLSSLDIARTLRSAGADLVHCSDVIAGFQTVLGAWLADLPVICHVRNPHDAIPRRYRSLLRGVERFVFVSRHAREHFPMRLDEARAPLVYDAVDANPLSHTESRAAVLAEFHIPSTRRLVCMAARFAPQKDHATFLRAARRVLQSSPDTHFLLIGDHSGSPSAIASHERVSRLANELGLVPHLTFTGFRADISRLFAAMDVVVLATHFEGFGLVLVEAMVQGRPVVATGVGGVLEIITDEETGLLHRHEDPDHLAAQVLSLLDDEARASRLAAAGLQFAKDHFGQERFSASIVELYRGVLTRHAGR